MFRIELEQSGHNYDFGSEELREEHLLNTE